MSIKSYDVVVAGGGIAGCAAAIAAARMGRRTALIEKQCILGGLATSGLIYVYLPLCDGYGHQVTFGLAEELLQRCPQYSPFDVPARWGGPPQGDPGVAGDRYQCCFSPAGFTLVLDQMLHEAGVEVWLDTCVIGANCTERKLESLRVFNNSGIIEIEGGCFVDATGGAFLVQLAGGCVIPGANYLTPWVMEMADQPERFHFSGALHIQPLGVPGDVSRHVPVANTGKTTTDFIRQSWRAVRERYQKLPLEQQKSTYPVTLPGMPQIRMSAHIDALTMLNDQDGGKHFVDSVGTVGDWRHPAPTWDTPYGTLVPRDVQNVLAAGRCIGTTGEAWEVFRVIPAAAMTGEAAGLAAALCLKNSLLPRELKVAELQRQLAQRREAQAATVQ